VRHAGAGAGGVSGARVGVGVGGAMSARSVDSPAGEEYNLYKERYREQQKQQLGGNYHDVDVKQQQQQQWMPGTGPEWALRRNSTGKGYGNSFF
jgi:hypothetical protein